MGKVENGGMFEVPFACILGRALHSKMTMDEKKRMLAGTDCDCCDRLKSMAQLERAHELMHAQRSPM